MHWPTNLFARPRCAAVARLLPAAIMAAAVAGALVSSPASALAETAPAASAAPAGIQPFFCFVVGVRFTPACVGPAAKVTVALGSPSIVANGTSQTTATATVEDSGGDKITGDTITFSANPSADVTIGTVTNNGNGTYTATITSSTTVNPAVTITATDTSVSPTVSGSNQLALTSPPVTTGTGTGTSGSTGTSSSSGSGGSTAGGSTAGSSTAGSSTAGSPTPTITTAATGSTSPNRSAASASKIRSSLASVLKPLGAKASIKALLASGGYTLTYTAPSAGALTVVWYSGSGKKRKLIASARLTASGTGKKLTARLRLTAAGRAALLRAKTLRLTSDATFSATGGASVERSATFTLR